ncbi:MAG: glutathione S-transferase [Myxococcales bacterium]|nr:glutathione S-transferase [Myxococcales bacterium]
MKIYWCPRTRASRVVWMLEELGRPYERVYVDIRAPGPRDPEFLAASPMGKVPALADGPVTVADSAAICLYLADRYASGTLAPAIDDPSRGRFLYWIMYAPGVFEPAMAEKFSGLPAKRQTHGWGDFPAMIATLEAGLAAGPWIMGDTFTAADVLLGSSVAFLRMFGGLPDSPVLSAYADRCVERPAYRRAMALDEQADAPAGT